jgi:hypothetical protein
MGMLAYTLAYKWETAFVRKHRFVGIQILSGFVINTTIFIKTDPRRFVSNEICLDLRDDLLVAVFYLQISNTF